MFRTWLQMKLSTWSSYLTGISGVLLIVVLDDRIKKALIILMWHGQFYLMGCVCTCECVIVGVSLSLCVCTSLEGNQCPFRVVFVNSSIVGQVPGSESWKQLTFGLKKMNPCTIC